MANCCMNSITIVGDEKKVEQAYNVLKDVLFKEQIDFNEKTGTLCIPLITLACHWGIYDVDVRGEIYYLHYKDGHLVIESENDWDGKLNFWQKVLPYIGTGLKLFYYTEECGLGMFQTNDLNREIYTMDYSVRIDFEGVALQNAIGVSWYDIAHKHCGTIAGDLTMCKEDLIAFMQDLLPATSEDIPYLLDKIEQKLEDVEVGYFYIDEIARLDDPIQS